MADFFSDVFNSFTGQQAIPQSTILDPTAAYQQGIGMATAGIPALNSYNNALALGNANAQLGYEAAVNPYANPVRTGAYKSVLDNLNLGTSLSPELTADITRKLYESGAATGFGSSSAGIGNIALQTGLEANALGRQRQNDALQAAGGLALTRAAFEPDRGITPSQGTSLAYETQSAKDNYENTVAQIKADNFSSLLSTGFEIAGMAAGAAFGGGAGASIGKTIGGSLFNRKKGGGGGFNPLSTFGFGGGSQGAYADSLNEARANSVPALSV